MLIQNIRLYIRSITRQKLYFILTLSGLTLGITAVFLAFVFISDESGYDSFHTRSDRIFRVNKYVKEDNGEITKNAESPGMMAPVIESEIPEVEMATHIAPWFNEVLVSFEDRNIFVKDWVFADPNFFNVFDFKLIRGGDAGKILNTPGQVIVTPKLAQTLFGNTDPIGKVFTGLNEIDFTVAGLVESPPKNSHIQFDAIVSWASTESQSNMLNFSFMNNWLGQTVYTYLSLYEPEDFESVNAKFADFTARHMENRRDTYTFYLQPIEDIYLYSTDLHYLRGGKFGSAAFLRTFTIIALLILLIACFNYINISTVQSLHRAKEIGIKKVLGANKKLLINQFMTETMCTALIAGIIAVGFAQLLIPVLNQWFGKEIPVSSPLNLNSLAFLFAGLIITSLIAGIFPGVLLTKFKAISMLSQNNKMTPGGKWPRQILISLQLIISIGLIAGTLMIFKQFKFILNKDLGFEKEQVLVMNTPPGIQSNHQAFQNQLVAIPGVQSVSMCQAVVGDGTFGSTVIPEGLTEEMMIQMFRVDTNYIETFGMDMVEGRFLGMASDFDVGAMVVNESFVRQAGWEDPLDRFIGFPGSEFKAPVVGVLKDFHFNSLHQQVTPLVMYLDDRKHNTAVRFNPQQLSTLLPNIEALWNKFETKYPFDYYFLDEFFAGKYIAEKQMLRVISLFAIVAIFVACLGLYGLAAFAMARRTKEIGIRKVLGATVLGIIRLLAIRFVKLVVISFLISIPFIFYLSQNWLNQFAYHANLSWWLFVLAGIIALTIVMLTVSFQSIKAALVNPAKSLRNE